MSNLKAIKLAATDNVATLLADAPKHASIDILSATNEPLATLTCLQAIPFGNKIALSDITDGEQIIKAGHSIGKSIAQIPTGQLVHVQNVRSERLDIPQAIIEEIIKQMGIEKS